MKDLDYEPRKRARRLLTTRIELLPRGPWGRNRWEHLYGYSFIEPVREVLVDVESPDVSAVSSSSSWRVL